ncbi:MAG: NAD(P)H-dependent oxidoreductase [Actinomycetota bacterium]|nr:NAD(P)H-dependent oxidoreductase [Actinomycetota bacterium]
MRILAVSGSLRRQSYNTALLRAAAEVAPPDVEVDFYDELEVVPPYNEEREPEPPRSVTRLRERIARADAVLFATPEYNASVPGQLKNAIDWASRPHRRCALWAKPVAVIGASPGSFGAMWAQAELRKILGASGARVLDADLPVARASERFDGDGRLVDEQLRESLGAIVVELVALARPVPVAA